MSCLHQFHQLQFKFTATKTILINPSPSLQFHLQASHKFHHSTSSRSLNPLVSQFQQSKNPDPFNLYGHPNHRRCFLLVDSITRPAPVLPLPHGFSITITALLFSHSFLPQPRIIKIPINQSQLHHSKILAPAAPDRTTVSPNLI